MKYICCGKKYSAKVKYCKICGKALGGDDKESQELPTIQFGIEEEYPDDEMYDMDTPDEMSEMADTDIADEMSEMADTDIADEMSEMADIDTPDGMPEMTGEEISDEMAELTDTDTPDEMSELTDTDILGEVDALYDIYETEISENSDDGEEHEEDEEEDENRSVRRQKTRVGFFAIFSMAVAFLMIVAVILAVIFWILFPSYDKMGEADRFNKGQIATGLDADMYQQRPSLNPVYFDTPDTATLLDVPEGQTEDSAVEDSVTGGESDE